MCIRLIRLSSSRRVNGLVPYWQFSHHLLRDADGPSEHLDSGARRGRFCLHFRAELEWTWRLVQGSGPLHTSILQAQSATEDAQHCISIPAFCPASPADVSACRHRGSVAHDVLSRQPSNQFAASLRCCHLAICGLRGISSPEEAMFWVKGSPLLRWCRRPGLLHVAQTCRSAKSSNARV